MRRTPASRKLPAESQPHVSQQLHFEISIIGNQVDPALMQKARLSEEVSDGLIVASGELASEADSAKQRAKTH